MCVYINIPVFWYITEFRLVDRHMQTFRSTFRLHLQGSTIIINFGLYTVCLTSKCTDFPMDELEM
jgi:hypothetical protein